MRIAAFFLWLLAPIAVWLVIHLFGTPHIVGSYRFIDNGEPYNLQVPRQYVDCRYHGWTGSFTVPAKDARCPWVRFFKKAPQ